MPLTVCHYPWNTLYIEPDGEVYPCCHKKPYRIGNLYQNDLADILDGPEADQVRREAQNGTLACFSRCTRAPSRQYHRAGSAPYEVEAVPRLKEIHLNVSTRCNLKCLMCRQEHRSHQSLDADRLAGAFDGRSSPRVILQGGEPTVIPAALKIARYVIDRTSGPLTLITNGLALGPAWEDLLLARENECRISLNGARALTHETVNRGSRFDKVMANIRRLADRRAKERSPLYMTLRMTVIPENVYDMPEFVRLAGREGYPDRIAFGFDRKSMPAWAGKNPQAFKSIYDEFLAAVAASPILADCWRMYQLAVSQGVETRRFRFGRKGEWLGPEA